MIQTRDGEQWWLLAYMKSLGHFKEFNPQALSQGVAAAGVHAVLAEDLKLFYHRFSLILTVPLERFPQAVQAAEEKRLILTTVLKSQELSLGLEGEIDKQLTEVEKACLSFKTLADTLAIAQAPLSFPQLFNSKEVGMRQDLQTALSILTPVKLEIQGGVVRIIQLKGSYTLQELTDYFQTLRKALTDFKHPISLVLRNTLHALTVGYHYKRKRFFLINANNLTPKKHRDKTLEIVEPKLLDAEDIAAAVISALFSTNNIAAFETGVYVTKIHEEELKLKLAPWIQQPAFEEMHLKGRQLDSNKIGLLYLAAYTDDLELAEKLLQSHTDPNTTLAEQESSPVFIAVQHGYPKLVQLLLKYGASPNLDRPAGGPLHVAAMGYDLAITRILINFGASVNQTNEEGSTPLHFAAMKENLIMAACLLENGAIPDQPNKKGVTPIEIAEAFNQPEIATLLKNARDRQIAAKLNEVQALYNTRVSASIYHHQALDKLQNSIKELNTVFHLDATIENFSKLHHMAQRLQKLIAECKPINNERKIFIEFLRNKIDLAYKTYAEAAPGTEYKAFESLRTAAKLIRDTVQKETKKPGFLSKLLRIKPVAIDPFENGLTGIIGPEKNKGSTLKTNS